MDKNLIDKIIISLKKIGVRLVYPVLVFFNVLKDKNIILNQKIYFLFSLLYLVVGTDVIPDFIPLLGKLDDLILLIFSFMKMNLLINSEHKKQACNTLINLFKNDENFLFEIKLLEKEFFKEEN